MKQQDSAGETAGTSIVGEVESFVRSAVELLEPPSEPAGRGRPRILPAVCLWAGMLVCVLRGFESKAELWRLLCQTGLWNYPLFPVTDEAVYKRLAKDGPAPFERLFASVSALLKDRLEPHLTRSLAPFATEVVAIDQTGLDKVARLLPHLKELKSKDPGLLPGKLDVVFDIRRQQWLHIQHTLDSSQNEKVAARELLATLPVGSLIIADLGYFAFAWFDHLTKEGYHWISRMRAKTSYKLIHTFYEQGDTLDCLIQLGQYRADRSENAVRLVQFRVGAHLFRYITSVRDPELLPIDQIARLYARRWDVEMAFNLVKTHLKLHLIWSAKPELVLQQVWACFTIAQVLFALRQEIASRAGADSFEVSLPLLIRNMPAIAATGRDPLDVIVEMGRFTHIIRPSRRNKLQTPHVPSGAITPAPDDLRMTRTPRYAGKSTPRKQRIQSDVH